VCQQPGARRQPGPKGLVTGQYACRVATVNMSVAGADEFCAASVWIANTTALPVLSACVDVHDQVPLRCTVAEHRSSCRISMEHIFPGAQAGLVWV